MRKDSKPCQVVLFVAPRLHDVPRGRNGVQTETVSLAWQDDDVDAGDDSAKTRPGRRCGSDGNDERCHKVFSLKPLFV